MVHMCIVCKLSSKENKDLSFHKFPKNEVKKQVWANVLGVTVTTDWNYVCGNHFSSDSYAFSNARKILKPTAIPFVNTIFTQYPNKCTQKNSFQITTNVLFDHCYAASTCPQTVCASTSNNPQISEIDIENCDDLPCSLTAFTSTLKTSNIVLDYSFDSFNRLKLVSEQKGKELPLDATPTFNRYPKKKRFFSSSGFGDLSVSDFGTPQQANRNFALVQNIIYQLRTKNKILNQRNKRLQSKVSSLNHTIAVLKKKSLKLKTTDNLEALGSDVLINLVKNCLSVKKESYSNATKEFSETLHRYSPKAYCYVRNILGKLLPHPRTLRKLRKNKNNISTCQT